MIWIAFSLCIVLLIGCFILGYLYGDEPNGGVLPVLGIIIALVAGGVCLAIGLEQEYDMPHRVEVKTFQVDTIITSTKTVEGIQNDTLYLINYFTEKQIKGQMKGQKMLEVNEQTSGN